MKKKAITILKYLLFLGVGVFLVWWSLHQIPSDKWKDFKTAFATAKYGLLVPVFFILMTSHLLRAWRWKLLMAPLGHAPTLPNAFFAVMIGYLANLAVPRLGEVLKCTIIAKYENVPSDNLIGTIVAERAFDLLSLMIVFSLAFILQYEIIGGYALSLVTKLFKDKTGSIDISKLVITVICLIVLVFVIKFALKRFAHFKAIATIKNIFNGIWQGIISVKGLEKKGQFLIASFGIWFMYFIGTWVGFNATTGTSGLSLEVAVSTLAFASIGMIIAPGGIGAYAFFLARVLQQNGIPFEIGFANGTLQWFAQFLIIIFAGFISMGLLPYYNKKIKKHEENRIHSQQNI